MAHDAGRREAPRARAPLGARPLALIFLLAAATAAAPASFTREKLELLPGLWPDEHRVLVRKVMPDLAKGVDVAPALLEAGVAPRAVALLAELAPGPLLTERYAHRVLREAPDLDARQSALLEHLVRGAEAAEYELVVHREKLLKELALAADDPMRRRIQESYERQIREIEKRLWRVAGWALTLEQRIALKRLYPPAYARIPNLQGHVYQLPDLTASQAARVAAIVAEYESESAADGAEVQRLQARLRDPKLPAEERTALQAKVEAASDRVVALARSITERGRAILTEAQAAEIDGLVPLQGPEDRRRNPAEYLLPRLGVTPEQQAALQSLAAAAAAKVKDAQAAAAGDRGAMGGDMGSDSPQAMTMRMIGARAEGRAVRAMEEAVHAAVLDVLSPRQLLAWVLAPD